jgi:hypothetical protein
MNVDENMSIEGLRAEIKELHSSLQQCVHLQSKLRYGNTCRDAENVGLSLDAARYRYLRRHNGDVGTMVRIEIADSNDDSVVHCGHEPGDLDRAINELIEKERPK